MSFLFSRRSLLAAGAVSMLPTIGKSKSLRMAHMTDFHVQPELGAAKGAAKAMQHAMNLRPKVDLVMVGGDLIMDGFAQTEARTKLQWELYKGLVKENIHVPIHHALGNHDVWGWDKKDSHTDGSERLWAKKWFKDVFGYEKTYHSFDLKGWHFVVLDNILLTSDGYNGLVDDAQMEWLQGDLASTKLPTVVMSHIPLLSVTALVGGYNTTSGEWNIGGDVMTKNLDPIRALFAKNPHVKIALSGHMHMIDRVDFKGVSYMCSGAVCGNWWKGPLDGFEPGYRVLDLNSDGTFEEQFIKWGWQA